MASDPKTPVPSPIPTSVLGAGTSPVAASAPMIAATKNLSSVAPSIGSGIKQGLKSGVLNEDDLNNLISSLNYGSEANPSKSQASEIASSLEDLAPSDAQNILKKLSGTNLGTSVQNDITPTTAPTNSQPYGFDPLSIGNLLQTTLGPWMQQQAATSQGYANDYASQMASALKGASPQLQQAYAVTDPAMQQAMTGLQESATQEAFTQPEFDSLVSNLNNATTSAKAAQYAAAEEPYVAATQGLGTAGATTQGNTQNANTQAALYAAAYQAALNGTSNQANGLTPSTSINAVLAGQQG